MGLAINNNVSSLTAQNNLNKTNSMLGSSLEKLSTGLKVNRGADGPAALVISERQRAQISGLRTAIDNTNKAVSMVQTGEGALNEMTRLLNKARSLALDSANGGVNDANAFAANQAELTNIMGTINKIATSTEFNGKKLLDGTGAGNSLTTSTAGVSVTGSAAGAVGSSYAMTVTAATKAQSTGAGAFAVTANGTFTVSDGTRTASASLVTTDSVHTSVEKINNALRDAGVTNIVAGTATGGALELKATNFTTDITIGGTGTFTNGPASDAHNNASVTYNDSHGVAVTTTGTGNVLNLTGELAGISVNLSEATAGGSTSVGGAINFTAGQGFTFQIGANAGQTASVDFQKMTTDSMGSVGSDFLDDARVDSASSAQTALGLIDKALSDVGNFRGRLGAFQANTLESTANNLRTTLENTVAAESVIRDTDFASEIANFTKFQTMMQAGSTVLGNANQMTQLVAGLLRG